MGDILQAIVPIFIVVGVGFVATRAGLFDRGEIATIAKFVVKVALPVLVFTNVFGRSAGEIFRVTYLLTYALAALVMYALAFAYVKQRKDPTVRAAFMGLGMAGTNNGFIGMPMFLILFEQFAGPAIGMDMIVDNVLIIPLALFIAEQTTGSGSFWERVVHTGKGVLLHPMVLAIILALTLNAIGVTFPDMIDRPIKLLANASTGAALFAVGGMLASMKLRGAGVDIFATVAGKLLVMPAVGLGILIGLHALGLPELPSELKVAAVLTCALPPFSVLPSLAEPYGEADRGAASMMLATALSFLTLSGWMIVLQGFGWL